MSNVDGGDRGEVRTPDNSRAVGLVEMMRQNKARDMMSLKRALPELMRGLKPPLNLTEKTIDTISVGTCRPSVKQRPTLGSIISTSIVNIGPIEISGITTDDLGCSIINATVVVSRERMSTLHVFTFSLCFIEGGHAPTSIDSLFALPVKVGGGIIPCISSDNPFHKLSTKSDRSDPIL